jgi:Holliday junction resolvase-like predicted endonuclease
LGPLEIDVVAREEATLVLIEIRARSVTSLTSGLSSIGPRKRRLLRFAAERLWRKRYRYDPTLQRVRFDVISLTLRGQDAELEYLRAAF